ncbi:hypothetical protein ASD15_28795 [Massilia sp. Root351]|uniref:malonate decarboxylase holo-[acyl-carrier-protein] synthase n=1 Tax=Massilia sp. Root351 TaxID=1736522 RepID=UPI00070EBBBE|nr:malonate decarboxylase holo-[acyl-carrier-protein] synthase [Massilia sp. Root351]KQV87237.1 hypothetical protein ASD15_28795 [Massilia sp. Root351]
MFKRHDLVWLTRAGWQAALAADPAREAVFSYWQREEWPAVVRRCEPDAGPGMNAGSAGNVASGGPTMAPVQQEVCLGIALPPDADGLKQRIGLRAVLAHVERTSSPLTLKAARPALPAHWRPGYTELQRLSTGLDLRVFGSLAWQALTGLPCLGAGSDIDILFRPVSQQQLRAGLALLAGAGHGLPLDGEIMFPSGQAVSWKEWNAAGAAKARVLVKEIGGVQLADPEALLATLRPA